MLPERASAEREQELFALKKIAWLRSDLFLFFLVLTPFLYIIGTVLWHGIPDSVTAGDGAILEMSTRDVFSRGILLGPYSRFSFFHPGPLYFVIRYPFYMAMGQNSSSLLIVTALLASSCLFGAWYVIRKLTNRFTSILFSAVVALFLLNTDKTLWLSDWNPYIIMFPGMLYAVIMAAVGVRETRYLYLAVFAGSFIAQTHIGGIPALVFSAILALVCAVYPWMITSKTSIGSGYRLKHIMTGLALLLVLWAPPVYEEVTAEPRGNLTKIREFFEEPGSNQNSDTAFQAWSEMQSGFELNRFTRQLLANGLAETASTFVVAFRLLLLASGFSLLRRYGKFGFLCSLNLICLLLHGTTYYSVLQIRGELNLYLIEWMKVVAPLSLFTILASTAALLKETGAAAKFQKYAVPALAFFLVYASFMLTVDVSGYFRTDLDPSWEDEIAVRELSLQVAGKIRQETDYYYILRLQSGNRWPVLVGLMNSLEKQELPVGMDDNLFFKRTPAPDGATVRILHLCNIDEAPPNVPGLIATYSGIGVFLE
jgi:ABC-type multidrug transport system fused ATPase/permease subunit